MDNKLKAAGVRMALRMIPADLLEGAPTKLASYLNERLARVELAEGETRAAYLLAGQGEQMTVATVAMDAFGTVHRVVETTTMNLLFSQILNQLKEL